MNLADQIYSVYQELYNESTNEFWEEHASRLFVSSEILRELFSPKENEQIIVREFMENYINDNWFLRNVLAYFDRERIDILDVDTLRSVFENILSELHTEDIEEIMCDEEEYYVSCTLCEGIMMGVKETLQNMIQENVSFNFT